MVNYAAGLTPVALLTFAAGTAIGCAPRAFAYTTLGGSLTNLDSPEAIVAFAVLVGMAILGIVVALRDVRIRRRILAYIETGSLSAFSSSGDRERAEAKISLSGDRERPPASDESVTRSESEKGTSSPDDRSADRP
jgi:hypothetical protein